MLREFMKRLFNRQDKTTKVVNQIDEVYKKSLEDDEIKDAEQSAAQKVIEYVRKNPENAIEILKGILEKDEIPNKVFEKVNVSDKIIENIIENGSVNRPEKIELINNIDDEELKQKKVEEELKQIYQNCEKTSELELVHKLETIRIVQKNPSIEKLEEMIVAKRMALNYRDFGGTKISTLARYLSVDKMIEVNIPEMVCNEYEKIKEEEKNKVDKSSLKTQILQEIAKKVANSYQEVGEFVIPQSRNMTQLTRKEEENFIKSIQTYVRKKLRATDITSIRDQIRGRDTNMLLKQYIEKMKRLPKAQLEMFIHNTGELVENNEELTVYKELKDSGMIENLQKFSDDKRKDYIKVLNDTVQKRVEEKSHNNPNDKQTPNDEPEI